MIINHTEDVAALRRAQYPPLTDLADAMYWASRGDMTKLDAYYAAIEAVKARFPKSPDSR